MVRGRMSNVRCQISVSLDGFVAGPNQSPQHPLGEGGERLHDWAVATESWRSQHDREGGQRNVDSDVIEALSRDVGAYVMGRRMFGGGEGEWDLGWKGWWGDDPPFHVPVYVLTHHARERLVMEGGTTFTFVTEGIDAALDMARETAGDRDVVVSGGASAARQYLAAGLLDELYLHVAPVVLGAGERLLEDVGDVRLEIAETIPSPAVTHVRYRVVR
jgi:dihydrofolate reductase